MSIEKMKRLSCDCTVSCLATCLSMLSIYRIPRTNFCYCPLNKMQKFAIKYLRIYIFKVSLSKPSHLVLFDSYSDVETEDFSKDKMELRMCSWDCPEVYPWLGNPLGLEDPDGEQPETTTDKGQHNEDKEGGAAILRSVEMSTMMSLGLIVVKMML